MLLSLAWKNIWRNKKRSLIIILAIIFGLWGGLMSGALMMGWGESIVNTAIERDLSHIQIHKKGFTKNKEIENYIPDGMEVLKSTAQTAGVKAVSGRTIIYGMAASPASTFGVRIVGINPENAKKVTSIQQNMIAGSYFASERKNQIVISQKLARRLNLKLHAKIVLSFQGLEGDIDYLACRVVGIYKTVSAQFDERHVFVRQDDLYRILDSPPIIHEIAIRLQSSSLLTQTHQLLQERYKTLAVQTWLQIAPEIAFLSKTMESFTYLFVAIILFALLFGITNTMLMSVIDRTRELGVLIAIGMKKGRVFVMILLETICLSITGGFGGILLGWISIAYVSHTGLDLSSVVASSLESFGASAVLHPFLPFFMYLMLTIMVIVAANIAAVYPAWKAIHLQPSEAIRTY